MFTTKKRTFNQHDNEKESFYKFSAPNFPNQIKLNENISTDVCIIGCGLTGISSAYAQFHLENIYNLFLCYLHEERLV